MESDTFDWGNWGDYRIVTLDEPIEMNGLDYHENYNPGFSTITNLDVEPQTKTNKQRIKVTVCFRDTYSVIDLLNKSTKDFHRFSTMKDVKEWFGKERNLDINTLVYEDYAVKDEESVFLEDLVVSEEKKFVIENQALQLPGQRENQLGVVKVKKIELELTRVGAFRKLLRGLKCFKNIFLLSSLPIPRNEEEFDMRMAAYEVNKNERRVLYLEESIRGYTVARTMYYEAFRKLSFFDNDFEILKFNIPGFTHSSHRRFLKKLLICMRKIAECSFYICRLEDGMNMCQRIVSMVARREMDLKSLKLTYATMGRIMIIKKDFQRASDYIEMGLSLDNLSRSLTKASVTLEKAKWESSKFVNSINNEKRVEDGEETDCHDERDSIKGYHILKRIMKDKEKDQEFSSGDIQERMNYLKVEFSSDEKANSEIMIKVDLALQSTFYVPRHFLVYL